MGPTSEAGASEPCRCCFHILATQCNQGSGSILSGAQGARAASAGRAPSSWLAQLPYPGNPLSDWLVPNLRREQLHHSWKSP